MDSILGYLFMCFTLYWGPGRQVGRGDMMVKASNRLQELSGWHSGFLVVDSLHFILEESLVSNIEAKKD